LLKVRNGSGRVLWTCLEAQIERLQKVSVLAALVSDDEISGLADVI